MLYHHPPSQELRQTIDDLELDKRLAFNQKDGAPQHQACACCHVPERKSARKLKILAIIVFIVTTALVALNAYQREQSEREENLTAAGNGAAHATETIFPVKAPVVNNQVYYVPAAAPAQPAMPVQTVRPGEPTAPCIALPVEDTNGNIRLKRFVSR